MIFDAAHLKRVTIQTPQGSRQKGVDLRPKFSRSQKRHPVFGGE
jgi:hypothetical protein